MGGGGERGGKVSRRSWITLRAQRHTASIDLTRGTVRTAAARPNGVTTSVPHIAARVARDGASRRHHLTSPCAV